MAKTPIELADWLHVAGAAGIGTVRENYDQIEAILRAMPDLLAACKQALGALPPVTGRGPVSDAVDACITAIGLAEGR